MITAPSVYAVSIPVSVCRAELYMHAGRRVCDAIHVARFAEHEHDALRDETRRFDPSLVRTCHERAPTLRARMCDGTSHCRCAIYTYMYILL